MSTPIPTFNNDAEAFSWIAQKLGGPHPALALHYLMVPGLNDTGLANVQNLAYVRTLDKKQLTAITKPGNKSWVIVDARGALLHFVSAHNASMAVRGYRAWAAKKGLATEPANVFNLPRWTRMTGFTKATSGYGHLTLVVKCPPNVGIK